MQTNIIRVYAMLLFSLLLNSTSQANAEIGKYCANDVAIYCPHVKPGQGRIGRCLALHKPDLSTPCQAVVATAMHILRKHIIQQCGPEIRRYCANVIPGNGRIFRCLTDRYDNLSTNCAHLTKKITGVEPEKHKDY